LSTYNKALINRGNISIWFDSATQWLLRPLINTGEIKPILMQQSNAA